MNSANPTPYTLSEILYKMTPNHFPPLFRLDGGGFPRDALIKVLKSRLQTAGIPLGHYSGHSFRRGAAQHAKDNGLLDEHV